MLYVMFYAIVTSGPMAEHNNGRFNTIGLGPIGRTPPATHDDVDLFRERSGTLWDFMELYVWGKSSGTLWNFIMGLMERNNYVSLCSASEITTISALEILRKSLIIIIIILLLHMVVFKGKVGEEDEMEWPLHISTK